MSWKQASSKQRAREAGWRRIQRQPSPSKDASRWEDILIFRLHFFPIWGFLLWVGWRGSVQVSHLSSSPISGHHQYCRWWCQLYCHHHQLPIQFEQTTHCLLCSYSRILWPWVFKGGSITFITFFSLFESCTFPVYGVKHDQFIYKTYSQSVQRYKGGSIQSFPALSLMVLSGSIWTHLDPSGLRYCVWWSMIGYVVIPQSYDWCIVCCKVPPRGQIRSLQLTFSLLLQRLIWNDEVKCSQSKCLVMVVHPPRLMISTMRMMTKITT